jgi:hypothetical protein
MKSEHRVVFFEFVCEVPDLPFSSISVGRGRERDSRAQPTSERGGDRDKVVSGLRA